MAPWDLIGRPTGAPLCGRPTVSDSAVLEPTRTDSPRVSIGMPVFNGERYLADAIESILGQTFDDFELVISDNASTDRTPSISRGFAVTDRRVRYVRQPENLGAAPNFNFLVGEARGEYFKWAAHDDVLAPDYLERTVAALDANVRATLACTGATVIDANGKECSTYVNPLDLAGNTPEERFRELIKFYLTPRYEIFGVFRLSALRGTSLIGGFTDGDGVLLAHVALRGPVVELKDPLFYPRRHEGQSQRLLADKRIYDAWFDAKNVGRRSLPHFRLLYEYGRVAASENLTLRQRLSCWHGVGLVGAHSWRLLRGDIRRFLGSGHGRGGRL